MSLSVIGNQAHTGGNKAGREAYLDVGGTVLTNTFVTGPDSVEVRLLFSLNETGGY